MSSRYSVVAGGLLSVLLVLCGGGDRAAAQQMLRSLGTRGLHPYNTPRSAVTPRVTRPMINQPAVPNRVNVNPGGPLNFNYTPGLEGPVFFFFDAANLNDGGDAAQQGDVGLTGGSAAGSLRPSIHPRLDLTDQKATQSVAVLQQIRDAVNAQIAQCAERPLSAEWFAAHSTVAPLSVPSDRLWQGGSWADLQALLGLDAAAQHYDFRPDSGGLIFVYRDGVRRERAVDARKAAGQLAGTPASTEAGLPALPLGVFAAVPPIQAPVQSLLQLVVDQSGAISGYAYDFATDSAAPLHGAVDPDSQRAAWRVAGGVMEAGLVNLTEDVGRALLFRDDGWTQAWILMRVPEPTSTTAATATSNEP